MSTTIARNIDINIGDTMGGAGDDPIDPNRGFDKFARHARDQRKTVRRPNREDSRSSSIARSSSEGDVSSGTQRNINQRRILKGEVKPDEKLTFRDVITTQDRQLQQRQRNVTKGIDTNPLTESEREKLEHLTNLRRASDALSQQRRKYQAKTSGSLSESNKDYYKKNREKILKRKSGQRLIRGYQEDAQAEYSSSTSSATRGRGRIRLSQRETLRDQSEHGVFDAVAAANEYINQYETRDNERRDAGQANPSASRLHSPIPDLNLTQNQIMRVAAHLSTLSVEESATRPILIRAMNNYIRHAAEQAGSRKS